MSFSLNSVKQGVERKPRKIIIYGPPKMGKSTLAGSAKNALLIPTEDRVAHIDCAKTNVVHDYKEIIEIFDVLLKEKKKHNYKRVIIDSIDWLEPLIHRHVCEKKGWDVQKGLTNDHNKDTAFQKGLKYHAVEGWKSFFRNCDVMRDNGFDIILVAHDQTITVKPPNTDDYDKAVMKIDKNSLSVLEEWADVIAYYAKDVYVKTEEKMNNKKGKALSGSSRVLHLDGESPAMINGNSFGLSNAVVTLPHCTDIMEWLLTEKSQKQTKTTKTTGEK
jgi:hypothetical protein